MLKLRVVENWTNITDQFEMENKIIKCVYHHEYQTLAIPVLNKITDYGFHWKQHIIDRREKLFLKDCIMLKNSQILSLAKNSLETESDYQGQFKVYNADCPWAEKISSKCCSHHRFVF